jgi:hypothetical protein
VAGRSRAGRAGGLLFLWQLWERFASWRWRAPSIPGAPNGILRVRWTTYHGDAFELPDGTHIARGDPVGEFHVNNRSAVDLVRNSRWDLVTRCREDLLALAIWVESPDFPPEIQAFYGVTLLGRGAARLGMTIRPRPVALYRRFERMYMRGLLLIYSYEGQHRFNRGETRSIYPEEVWLTRKELLRRYSAARRCDA